MLDERLVSVLGIALHVAASLREELSASLSAPGSKASSLCAVVERASCSAFFNLSLSLPPSLHSSVHPWSSQCQQCPIFLDVLLDVALNLVCPMVCLRQRRRLSPTTSQR